MSNKAIVLDYIDTVMNQKDLTKVETFWAGDMIQHNPNLPNGLDALRGLMKNADASLVYEPGLAMESDDMVMVHGRYSGWNGKTMIAVDIFRLENGKIVEHWDVMQEEIPAEQTANGNPMFPA